MPHPLAAFSLLGELRRGTRERKFQALVAKSTIARVSTPNSRSAASSAMAPAPMATAIRL